MFWGKEEEERGKIWREAEGPTVNLMPRERLRSFGRWKTLEVEEKKSLSWSQDILFFAEGDSVGDFVLPVKMRGRGRETTVQYNEESPNFLLSQSGFFF